MRPDTRSFSFTWLRGQKSIENVRQQQQEEEMPPVAEEVSSSDMEGQQSGSSGEISKEGVAGDDGWAMRRGSSGSRLRRLGSSLVRLGAGMGGPRYATMDDDSNFHQISEEPMPLDESDEEEEDVQEVILEEMGVARSRQQAQSTVTAEEVKSSAAVGAVVVLPLMPSKKQDPNIMTTNEVAAGLSLGKRLNKTVQDVKTSLGNFSQKFRKSTRRRYRMGPSTPGSMASPTRRILGRTPTKLYSPFGIESPASAMMKTPKRLDRTATPRIARKSLISGLVYSPSNNFRRDLDEARRGMEDFQLLSRDITRRSVRF